MANSILEQKNTPDRNAAPRAHSGAEERGKEKGKAENCDGLIVSPSPTAPFRWGVEESGVKLNLKEVGQKVF